MAWVLDLDGVIWLGDRVIAGAADAVERVQRTGETVVFVTNNSYKRREDVAGRLASFGIDVTDAVITSAMAAASLVRPGERVLVVGGPGVEDEMVRRGALVTPPVEVDAGADVEVVVVGYDPSFDYDRMRRAAGAVRGGARLVATNDDATYPTPAGLVPGAGSILASIVTACGRPATVAGKPYAPMVDVVRSIVGTTGVVVGDRPDTDGRFAAAMGFRFGLVLSGVTTRNDLPVEPEPTLVAADLAAMVDTALRGTIRSGDAVEEPDPKRVRRQ